MLNPIIIDTDIGDDIDDALALAVALNSPELELRGVTTVFRDAPRRTLLVKELLNLLGHEDIPIAAGYSRPLLQPWSTAKDDGLPDERLGRQFEALSPTLIPDPTEHAIEFLRDQVLIAHDAGEKLTIVGIGPLTNIGLLFYRYPELVPLCRVALMAGSFFSPKTGAEWNVLCDPEAAAMTLRALTEDPDADLSFVGLDVTMQCVLDDADVRQFHNSKKPHAQFLGKLIDLWAHSVILHDPLTILALFDECVTFEPKRVEIPLCGENRGKTVVVKGQPNCRVATDVDVNKAKALFMERVMGGLN